ncbi:hypothetical protein V1477_011340 [Vespula maculifrons]|uniref:Uncharacterized protein n=2 Tax=Vespula TaxID=7451 RepID=A0A834KE19_VESVU|nr:hypothetical protein HZH66_003838 [Vespula vulgaris]
MEEGRAKRRPEVTVAELKKKATGSIPTSRDTPTNHLVFSRLSLPTSLGNVATVPRGPLGLTYTWKLREEKPSRSPKNGSELSTVRRSAARIMASSD